MSFGNLRRVHHGMPSSCPSSSILTINAHSPHPKSIPLFIETSLLVAIVVVMCCRGQLSEEKKKKKSNSMLACNQSIYMIKRFSLNFLFIHHHSAIFPIVAFYIVKREYANLAYWMIVSVVSLFDLPFSSLIPFVSSLNLHNVLFND